ncbi:glycosyltransferase [Nocardioides caldifontis]|uniref:glycosyltransferase n=1 Tax=Nocardioides caldifontis TaxID=2588938 RepID=UPI0011E05384|nr:glycosyltransferase [Nocardioides caldifontis]
MRVLLWHVHGSWTTSFVQGDHDYLLPVTPDRGPAGLGRALTWDWPSSVVEVPVDRLAEAQFDVVVLQRPHEAVLCERWTGRRPGRDVPAVYVEHNTPGGDVPYSRHPMADQREVPIIHVTHFNRLFWDCGSAPTDVVEHGIVDPGHRYTGELPHAAVAINDPVRRGRAVGTDLLPVLAEALPVDAFGMRVNQLDLDGVTPFEDLPQERMHAELARRRVYIHTARWTSLGLSLLEAMHLGMPVVALDVTEAARAVPPGAGVLTNSPEQLVAAVRRFVADPEEARAVGATAREAALASYGLKRFLADWDERLLAAAARSLG